jgi:hypothetical protein
MLTADHGVVKAAQVRETKEKEAAAKAAKLAKA